MRLRPEVVGEDLKSNMRSYGRFTLCLESLLTKFVFEDIGFFYPSAQKVKVGDYFERNTCWEVVQENQALSFIGVDEADLKDRMSAARCSLFIGDHSGVEGDILIETKRTTFDEVGIGLFTV